MSREGSGEGSEVRGGEEVEMTSWRRGRKMGNLLNSRAGGSWFVSPSTLLGCFSPLLSQRGGEEQAATTEAASHCD